MAHGIWRRVPWLLPHSRTGRLTVVGVLILALVGSLSSQLTFTFRGGEVLLFTLDAGTVCAQIVTDHFHKPPYNDCIWEEIYYPEPAPVSGVVRRSTCHLDWKLPAIHRTFVSVTGEWWMFTLPLWCLLALALITTWFSQVRQRVVTRIRNGAIACATDMDSGASRRYARWPVWTSVFVGLLMLAIWLLSGWWFVTFSDRKNYHVDIWAGVVSIATIPECVASLWSNGPRAEFYYNGFRMQWTLPHTADCAQSTIGGWWELNIPLWAVFLVACWPLLFAIHRRLRHPTMPGGCAKCGYNLTGNLSGRCPECGVACPPAS